MKACLQFSTLLQTFFTDRLIHQAQASSHTIASYRDTFRLLLRFAQQQIGKPACEADDWGPGRFLSRELPPASGERSRHLRTQPECPLGSDPFLLPVRSSQRTGLLCLGSTCLGHTQPTL
jgi:hypothetical protein